GRAVRSQRVPALSGFDWRARAGESKLRTTSPRCTSVRRRASSRACRRVAAWPCALRPRPSCPSWSIGFSSTVPRCTGRARPESSARWDRRCRFDQKSAPQRANPGEGSKTVNLQTARFSAVQAETNEQGLAAGPTFEVVYEACVGFVFRTARRLGVPEESIDDVVQEVFVVVHRRLS